MIVYDLACPAHHRFEGWFDGEDDFARQTEAGLLSCPVCESAEVRRLPSAPRINQGAANGPAQPVAAANPAEVRAREVLQQLQGFVDRNFENVGTRFAEEARRIHYGETDPKNIRGQATRDEVEALKEEGIEAHPLPFATEPERKLN